ncbi:DUF1826 domain-containing protein [Azospirillum sp. TSH100]|uniref:DUF1826 domain-containing protein n=1 Tax=Azospirillum sp. TSH100 TaxID=652764 RepID=UPI000D655699|nr:DUF1826 domain-containing protein [Azospirillum sp. TSH100]QCG90446.1 DUF1826 domain-containing protein [Azospirillum sp. TSH100]
MSSLSQSQSQSPVPSPAGASPCPSASLDGQAHVAECRTADALSVIRRPEINLAVWRRPLPAGVSAQSAWAAAHGLSCHLATSPDEAAADLLAALPPRRIEGPLLTDIVGLVRLYADLVGCTALRLRLDSLSGDGCRFFHVDYVGLRLLCTYRGAGTQWLPDGAVTRSALGRGDNEAVLSDPGRVQSLRAGDVALLKGEGWPGNRGRGLVHRSPPATPPRAPRLLLCLDHDEH